MELVKRSNQEKVINPVNQESLEEWIEYRIEKKKPLSNLALKKSTNLLAKFPIDHQAHIVDTAIMNDWQGLHVVDMPKEVIKQSFSQIAADTELWT